MLLVLALLNAVVARLAGKDAGRLVAALFASAGLALGLTQNTMTEAVQSAFALGAFVLIVAVTETRSRSWVLAVGILLGGCLGSKASAVAIVAPLFVLLVVVCMRKESVARGGLIALAAGAVGLVFGASAYVYAYAKTGNPIFPLHNELFKSPYAALSSLADERWYGHLTWAIPFKMTFHTSLYLEGYDGSLGFQYLLFLPAGVAAAIICRKKTLWVSAVAGLAIAGLFVVTMQYARYLFPGLAITALAAGGVFLGVPGETRVEKKLVRWIAVAAVGLNLAFLPAGTFFGPGFDPVAAVSSASAHQTVVSWDPYRLLNDVVNKQGGKSATVAYLGYPGGAGLQGMALYVWAYNVGSFWELSSARDPQEVLDFFRKKGADYVVLDQATPDVPLVRSTLRKYAKLVASYGGARLYRLDPNASVPRNSVSFRDEWYADEWVGVHGTAVITMGAPGKLTLTLTVPSYLPRNAVRVVVDGKTVWAGMVVSGVSRTIETALPKGVSTVRISCRKAVSPVSANAGPDTRPFGVHVDMTIE